MERVIVERLLTEPLTIERLAASACSSEACFKLHRIRHLRSYISRDGLRVFCEFEAPDAEAVRRANLSAQLPFEQVWTATVYEPPLE